MIDSPESSIEHELSTNNLIEDQNPEVELL